MLMMKILSFSLLVTIIVAKKLNTIFIVDNDDDVGINNYYIADEIIIDNDYDARVNNDFQLLAKLVDVNLFFC